MAAAREVLLNKIKVEQEVPPDRLSGATRRSGVADGTDGSRLRARRTEHCLLV